MDLKHNFRHGIGEDNWNFLLNNLNLFFDLLVRVALDKFWGLVSTSRPTRFSSLILSKVLVVVWRAERNRIPTLVELNLKGIGIPSILCPICDNDSRTVDHILAKWDWVSHLWKNIFSWRGFEIKRGSSFFKIIDFINNLSLENNLFHACQLSCLDSVIFSSSWLI